MSVQEDHPSDPEMGGAPLPKKWRIFDSDIRTVEISHISLAASKRDIQEFFSFSGDIQYVEMQRDSERTQVAYITYKEPQGAETALLLTGSSIANQHVSISLVENYRLPPEALIPSVDKNSAVTNSNSISTIKKAEDVVSTMLAKGFFLGKDAINKAKAFDEQHHLMSNASAAATSIDHNLGLTEKLSIGTVLVSEKMREVDSQFQLSEKARSAFYVAEQKASSAGTALMNNHYVLAGASWLSRAMGVVAKAAEDVSTMTKEKVEKAEEEKNEIVYWERTGMVNNFAHLHLDEPSPREPPTVPVISADDVMGTI